MTRRIYAANHSLGPPSPAVTSALADAIAHWESELVLGWDHWLDLAVRVGDRLGAACLGAGPGQVIVGDSTSVNLYKLASAALDARPDRRTIVVAPGEFPTDRYVLEGIAHARGLGLATEVDRSAALVCRSLVDFRTSTVADMAASTAEAHAAGAVMLWDVSHAVGIMPVDLDASRAELAVGCTYKWLSAGPGAPAFAYVRRDLHELRQPIWGWFGQRDQFAMAPSYDPEPDIRRFQVGTPPILMLAAVDAAVGVIEEIGIDAVREKSLGLTSQFIDAVALEVVTPREPLQRGGHAAVRHPEAELVQEKLRAGGVIVDHRDDLVRFGFPPLTTTAADVSSAAEALLASA